MCNPAKTVATLTTCGHHPVDTCAIDLDSEIWWCLYAIKVCNLKGVRYLAA
jgi:hypothetical protein